MLRRTSTLPLFLLAFLAGCGPSRQNLPVPDVTSAVPADQSRVVVGRKSNFLYGNGIKYAVKREGVDIGALAAGGFLAWDQPPGKTVLTVEGKSIPLDLKAGQPTCVEVILNESSHDLHITVVDPGNYLRLTTEYSPPE